MRPYIAGGAVWPEAGWCTLKITLNEAAPQNEREWTYPGGRVYCVQSSCDVQRNVRAVAVPEPDADGCVCALDGIP